MLHRYKTRSVRLHGPQTFILQRKIGVVELFIDSARILVPNHSLGSTLRCIDRHSSQLQIVFLSGHASEDAASRSINRLLFTTRVQEARDSCI